MSHALAAPIAAYVQRYPALARAMSSGLVVRVREGVTARLAFRFEGDRVIVPVSLPRSEVTTIVGAVRVEGSGVVSMKIEDFARALQLAETHGVMPRLDALIGHAAAGRPLLNLPR